MASILPFLALAAAKGATGYLQGRQVADERAEERRRRQVAEALQKAQADRQARMDAAAEAERQRQAALEPVELAQRGVFKGPAPATPPTLAFPTEALGVGFLDNGVTPHPDQGRYVQAGDYYLDQEATPEYRAAQRTLRERAEAARAASERSAAEHANRLKEIAERARLTAANRQPPAPRGWVPQTKEEYLEVHPPRMGATGGMTPSMRAKYTAESEKIARLRNLLANYEQVAGSPKFVPGQNSAEDARAASLYEALRLQLKEVNNMGVPNFRDLEILERQIAPPTGANSVWRGPEGVRAQVGALRQTLDAAEQSLGAAYGGSATPQTRPAPGGGQTGMRNSAEDLKAAADAYRQAVADGMPEAQARARYDALVAKITRATGGR